MTSILQALLRNIPLVQGNCIFKACIFLVFLVFSIVNAQDSPNGDTPDSSAQKSAAADQPSGQNDGTASSSAAKRQDSVVQLSDSAPAPDYVNFAEMGSYINEPIFGQIPEWHYYDAFGNKIIDGYSMYALSMNRNNKGTGISTLTLHPFMKKWLNGLLEVADLHEDYGIQGLIGDRVRSEFTPFSFKQTLFAGTRLDAFYKQNYLTFLTNRVSNTGLYGMLTNVDMGNGATNSADWITGVHGGRKFGEAIAAEGTYVNIHHEESITSGNPFSGTDKYPGYKGNLTGLSLCGLDFNLADKKMKAYGEYLMSQEFLDGNFLPKPGVVATFNGQYDISDKWRGDAELYSIGSRFQTNFTCLAHQAGDIDVGTYQYRLVEDNDDHDEYPENGRTKYPYFTKNNIVQGDLDGTIPAPYDKNKNGLWDYQEDFLNYESDPPESKILFDKNNNGIPDEVEDDIYPDYPYVPGYYLPGEKYYRYNDIDNKWEYRAADSLTHKGLAGCRLFTRYKILPNLEITVGGIFEKSQEKSFQPVYRDGAITAEVYDAENATSLYFMAHYKKNLAADKSLIIDDVFRKTQDNIPNHTAGFVIFPDKDSIGYYLVPDKLEYRDALTNAFRAEFDLFKNRGFNCAAAAKFEFRKHFSHPEFNYRDEAFSSLAFVNKCHYIFLLPFFKDMFLVPKFKNVWELNGASDTVADSLHFLKDDFKRNVMTNAAYLEYDWKITDKTSITTGLQLTRFDDFVNKGENYWEPCFSFQLTLKDRYLGNALVLTTGFTWYEYNFEQPGRHNSLNNPHRVTADIDAHEFFVKFHCGFL